jgi:hypothetical protein
MKPVMNLNATSHEAQQMNTTILNYPGFQTLPRGVRQMLLVSEAFFFNEPAPCHRDHRVAAMQAGRDLNDLMGIPVFNADIALEV